MDLGVLLFIAHRSLEERAYDAVVGAGATDVTVAQARLVGQLAPEGSRLTELAARARVTKQTAGHLVDQLERAGYVERTADPSDGRARLVRMTAKAEALVPVARTAVAGALDEWCDHIGDARMEQLREALTMIREITDPWR